MNTVAKIVLSFSPKTFSVWKLTALFSKSNKATEAVIRMCSVKKVFLEILQNPQENTCARDSFLIKLQDSGL